MQFELTRYLSDNWVPVIEKDVDGPNSLPLRIDGEVPNLGKLPRLPARGAHHLPGLGAHGGGGAPRARGPARQARLRDAGRVAGRVRRCAAAAGGGGDLPLPGRPALLVLDAADGHQARRGPRRAAQARSRQGGAGAGRAAARRPAQDGRLRAHPSAAAVRARTCPTTSTRGWSCCGVEHPYSKEPGSAAEAAAQGDPRVARQHARASTATRSSSSRPTRRGCRTSTRRCAGILAWESILAEKETLNLDPHQVQAGRDAEAGGRRRGDGAAAGDLPVAAGAGAGDAAGAGRRGRRSGSRAATRWPCGRARSSGATSCW